MTDDKTENIARWLPAIREARELLELSHVQYSDAVMLALIEVESAGDPAARRPGSRYHGLLQIARPYAIDASEWLDVDLIEPETLTDGEKGGYESILLALAYFERYSSRHSYVQSRIAALHKGGAGSARMLSDRLARGPREEGLTQAIEHVEKKAGVPNLSKYVKRFRGALGRWRKWLDEHDADDLPLACFEPTIEGHKALQDHKEEGDEA